MTLVINHSQSGKIFNNSKLNHAMEEGGAHITIPFPKFGKSLIILVPLYMVYFGVNILIELVPWIFDVSKRYSIGESVIVIVLRGDIILAAVFSVLIGILWARKILRGESTSQL